MSHLEIADTFDPYYAGREPFSCPDRSDPATAAEGLAGKGRNGTETSATAGARRPRPVWPRPAGR